MGIDEPDIDPGRFLEDVEMRTGEIVAAESFPEARKDLYRRRVDIDGNLVRLRPERDVEPGIRVY